MGTHLIKKPMSWGSTYKITKGMSISYKNANVLYRFAENWAFLYSLKSIASVPQENF